MQDRTKYDLTHVVAKSQTGRQLLAALQSVTRDWSRNPKCLKIFGFFLFFVLSVCILAAICSNSRFARSTEFRNPGRSPRRGWENSCNTLRNNEPSG